MSGIPGLFNRDGRPADPVVVARMIASAPHRGPDGARCWTSGAAAIGHQRMHLLPEDVPQPIVDIGRQVVLSFDGRLDNRGDLIRSLAFGAAAFRTPSDAELVLAAYDRWGEECAIHLLGDFAFAIWDGPRRRMFCARDVMGVKPFYYYLDARQFVWASDLRQILASGTMASVEPNEGMVAEYLAKNIQSQDETLYGGVMRLPAAHTMVVTAENVRIARYWQFDLAADLNYRTDGEYAEHFLALFKDAVACRLRTDGTPVGAYLSGGLDSSSVVCMAQSLGAAPETFSLVFPDTPEADESRYIDAVARKCKLPGHKIAASAVDASVCRAHVARRKDTLDLPLDLISEPLMARMRDRGTRVVLTGVGGDYCFSGSHYHYADFLQRGDVAGFARQLRADRGLPFSGWSPWQPFLYGVRPLIPQRWRHAVRPLAKRAGWVPGLPPWISPALAARVSLQDRLRMPDWVARSPTFSRRAVSELFASGWQYLLLEDGERSASEYGLDERHPFFDRRLIEFGMAIPESQRWQGRETKYVMRRAMGSLLPDSVATRDTKTNFNACLPPAVEALGGAAVFDSLCTASLDWVKQDAVSALYRNSRALFEGGSDEHCDGMFKLWMVGGIDLWYRSTFIEGMRHDRFDETRSGVARWQTGETEWPADPPDVPSAGTH